MTQAPNYLPQLGAATKAEVLAFEREWPQSEEGQRLLDALRWAGWAVALLSFLACPGMQPCGTLCCCAGRLPFVAGTILHPLAFPPAGAAAPRAGRGRA